jgi:hypothetical protein
MAMASENIFNPPGRAVTAGLNINLGRKGPDMALTHPPLTRLPDDDLLWIEMEYLHPGEAAAALRVTTGTVRSWACRGWIRFCRDGGRYQHAYSSEDVRALVKVRRGRGRPGARLIERLKAQR